MTLPNASASAGHSWLAEQLRLTAFPVAGSQPDIASWWQNVIGAEPENISSQPKLGIHQYEGNVGSGRVILVQQPGRLDWVYITAFDAQLGEPDEDNMLPFASASEQFANWMVKWHGLCPALKRLAFGAILNMPVSSREEGYRRIDGFLPSVQIDPVNSSDFLYQINRPREIAQIPSMRINRLTKWSVRATNRGRIEVAVGSPQLIPTALSFAVRLELDINTPQEFEGELRPEHVPSLFAELMRQGTEISVRGDHP